MYNHIQDTNPCLCSILKLAIRLQLSYLHSPCARGGRTSFCTH